MSDTGLSIEKLSFSYAKHAVLRVVSFTARAGELTAVLGPNGVGKTTLFRCVLGLERGYTGKITLGGTDVRTLAPRELANRIAYIPQVHSLNFGYTVREMVLMGTAHAFGALSRPGAKEEEAALEAMERAGIAGLANRSYITLSGGERQLTLIARALAQKARTLIMDEPTASLDYGNKERVLSLARSLADAGYTLVMSAHDPQQALRYAHTALALYEGGVEACGAPEEILTPALLEKLYGIRTRLIKSDGETLVIPLAEGRVR